MMAQAASEGLGKEVKYYDAPQEAAVEAFMGMGMPEWQARGFGVVEQRDRVGHRSVDPGRHDDRMAAGRLEE